jgi:hypothetical protein
MVAKRRRLADRESLVLMFAAAEMMLLLMHPLTAAC